ncbi:MAG: bifunctional hydroxymethylpyrimidine kinase/phosphomethylpyrimidine kinase [Myxococcota bacterium]
MRPVALSIAGSDSGGGAGIQADLRTFSRLDTFGTTVLTALTAQNLDEVRAVEAPSPEFVGVQIDTVCDGFVVKATKTGMLWSAKTIAVVAERRARLGALVVDPVMVATSGAALVQRDAVEGYREQLLPAATLATPNLEEAALLLTTGPIHAANLDDAARTFEERFGCPVLLKGGHLSGDPVDTLSHRGRLTRWRHPRVDGVRTHGTGCILSAAITAMLAHGRDLETACDIAMGFVRQALRSPHQLANHRVADLEQRT